MMRFWPLILNMQLILQYDVILMSHLAFETPAACKIRDFACIEKA